MNKDCPRTFLALTKPSATLAKSWIGGMFQPNMSPSHLIRITATYTQTVANALRKKHIEEKLRALDRTDNAIATGFKP